MNFKFGKKRTRKKNIFKPKFEMEKLNNLTISLNLNLRQPKKMSGTTNVYAVVKIDGKQMKMPLSINVYPWTWDKRRQEVKVSPTMAEEERAKNICINEKIWDVKKRYMEIISYLCMVDNVNADMVTNVIKEEFKVFKNYTDMANKNPIRPKRTITATKLLQHGFTSLYGESEENAKKSKGTYQAAKSKLNAFLTYIEENDKIYNSPNTLKEDAITAYYKYLKETTNYSHNVSVEKVNCIIRIINHLVSEGDGKKYGLQKIDTLKENHILSAEDKYRRALSENEVNAMLSVKTTNEKETMYQDAFRMQIESGVRVSDLPKLFTKQYEVIPAKGKKTLYIMTQKEEIRAIIYVNQVIDDLLQKYDKGLPFKWSDAAYNKSIKKFAKSANLDGVETYYKDENGVKVQHTDKLYNIIDSHFARHTFITNKVKDEWDIEQLCKCTGHADDDMIKKVYAHLTKEDEALQVVSEALRVSAKKTANVSANNVNYTNVDNETIYEYHQRIRHEISVNLARIEKNNHPFYGVYLSNFPTTEELNNIINAHGENIIETINARLEKVNLYVDDKYKIRRSK